MSDTNAIGLHSGSASDLAEKLNELLANYQIFYMNVRGYHWNVKGSNFFELHEKFEEFYTDVIGELGALGRNLRNNLGDLSGDPGRGGAVRPRRAVGRRELALNSPRRLGRCPGRGSSTAGSRAGRLA